MGYGVTICTFHHAVLPGIDVRFFPPLVKPIGKLNYLLHPSHIRTQLDQIKPDVLHAHYVSSYGVVGYLTGFHPFVVSVWGTDIYDAPHNFIMRYLIEKTLASADAVLSTSNVMAKQTRKFVCNKEVAVTPFGVDLRKYYPRKELMPDRFVVGTARLLAPKYGIEYLIKAFATVLSSIADAELHIAGDGPKRNDLIALTKSLGISKQVQFYGFVPPSSMPQFVSGLSVFCMPSIHESESFGVAALEAQACGIPVIASAIGGLHETVINNETGFLVKPHCPEEIADKLLYLYHNPHIRRKLGNQALSFVRENYELFSTVSKIENQYKQLMTNKSGRIPNAVD
jgi:glycosyltransferase involved in cell wall biosynthesis